MEKVLLQIAEQLTEIKGDVKQIKKSIDQIEIRLDKMDSRLDKMDSRLDQMDSRFDRIETRLDNLETDVKGIKEEHGLILRALLESKEIQRGEIDILNHRTAAIEGAIKGAAKQALENFKDASNL